MAIDEDAAIDLADPSFVLHLRHLIDENITGFCSHAQCVSLINHAEDNSAGMVPLTAKPVSHNQFCCNDRLHKSSRFFFCKMCNKQFAYSDNEDATFTHCIKDHYDGFVKDAWTSYQTSIATFGDEEHCKKMLEENTLRIEVLNASIQLYKSFIQELTHETQDDFTSMHEDDQEYGRHSIAKENESMEHSDFESTTAER